MPAQDFKGSVTIPASGGVDFSANHSAESHSSLLLDYYEEGAWTVVIADAATAGNESTTTGVGAYTRIGRLVHISFLTDNINTTGLTAGNAVWITALPFASVTGTNALGSVYTYKVALTGAPYCWLPASSSSIGLWFNVTGADATSIKVSDLTDDQASIYGSLTYMTAT
jgi:hypothetical protein